MSVSTKGRRCSHPRFNHELKMFYAQVTGLNIRQLVLKVKITCSECKRPYIFKGPTGFSTNNPLLSPDGSELRAPVELPDVEEEDGDPADPEVH